MLGLAPAASAAAAGPDTSRSFAQTGYSVDSDAFWAYFQHRGGVRTFGYSVSRAFPFLGCTAQFFQRLILQQCGSQGVSTMNLLDAGLLPYTKINGSTLPAPDPGIVAATPSPADPGYGDRIMDFVQRNAPDS